MRMVIKNARVLDTQTMSFAEAKTLVADDGIIVAGGESANADCEIDAEGEFVLPGFIDGHVHFRLATLDFARLSRMTEVEFGIVMARLSRQTLQRGFTTVRDLGGDVDGLRRAIKQGEASGPRIVRAGLMLTQTGGHGDTEGGLRPVPTCACEMRHTAFGIVADGVDAVRKAARHNLRDGMDFIKIHVSGGVASPSDPLESVQYTAGEIAAACEEARHRQTYVAAHAYSPESIRLAVENGVHTIEHGNLIDPEAAALMAEKGSILVPTLVAYEGMDIYGKKYRFPQKNLDKNQKVLAEGIASLEIARSAGVTMGFGTDLIGEIQSMQRREFSIRAEVESARDILHSMYVVNARLCHLEGKIGTLQVGAFADLVTSRINPLENIAGLADDDAITRVVSGGKLIE